MSVRWLGLATATLTFALMVLGGVVHATGSSLACPDWPTCHGELMPPMVGGVLYEHSHRMLGTLVGIFTLVLAAVLYRRGGARRWLGLGVLGLVIVQGVLGGLTVIYQLPPAVSTAHLATAFAFLGTLLYISTNDAPKAQVPARVASLLTIATAGVFLQSVLGALVRHTRAGIACGTDPLLCAGSLWPVHELGRLQMEHRGAAILVTLLVVTAVVAIVREPRCRRLRPLAFLSLALVVVQVGLGLLTVMTVLEVVTVTGHLATGALLFVVLLWQRLVIRQAGSEAWAAVRSPA